MTIKEFLKENSHLKLSIQHLGVYGGGFKVQVFNTTYDFGLEPVFHHYILDQELDSLNVDFDTAILTPIKIWLDDAMERRKQMLDNYFKEEEKEND